MACCCDPPCNYQPLFQPRLRLFLCGGSITLSYIIFVDGTNHGVFLSPYSFGLYGATPHPSLPNFASRYFLVFPDASRCFQVFLGASSLVQVLPGHPRA